MRFEPGNVVALRHGATSERQIAPLARNHRRRVLRQIGARSRELSPIARGYLNLYARLAAKIDLADAYIEEHGLLRDDGEPQPVLRVYVSLVNSARLTLARLEQHVGEQLGDPLIALEAAGRRVLEARGE